MWVKCTLDTAFLPLCYIPVLTSAKHYMPFPFIYLQILLALQMHVKCIPKLVCPEVSVLD